ncbi:MAG: ribosome-binding factor A [Anaerolineae bacterium CG_4_9_14_3_um_filter_57_17]|nr:MAG: ribosome-binding factor A [Anaerolineae bacterium CG_4_9_14_3_um_filter_57_17]
MLSFGKDSVEEIMPSEVRLQRIADRIREEISGMLLKEISDPRLHLVSVTDVTVDRELAFADVYVSAVEGETRAKEILTGMESASGFLRRELAGRVDLRAMPRLRFHWDPTPENADHMEKLFAQIRQEREGDEKK